MTRKSVYLETSVVSYLTARPSRDVIKLARQELTRQWWEERRAEYDVYISNAVLDEIKKGNEEAAQRRLDAVAGLPVLDSGADDAVDVLLEKLLSAKVVPAGALLDAYHIAVSAVRGISYLLTWNCAHINNAVLRPKISEVIRGAGYAEVIIATPEELQE